MSFAGYIGSCPFSSVCFPYFFFSERVPGLTWFGTIYLIYLVTTAVIGLLDSQRISYCEINNKQTTTHGQSTQQQSGQITLQSVLVNKPKFFKATRHAEIRKIEIPRSMVVEALSW